tara:strand:- start:39 stop:743 length:705 start_codon:yes stop_codon:yes gene_type:complete
MGYFRELPDFEYLSPLSDRNSSSEYIKAKNLFKRFKIRDDVLANIRNFERYEINGDDRPDQVAEEIYGSPDLDWVVLISANIINVRNDWPLSQSDIYDYAEKVYGNTLNEVRYHETIEIKDSKGRIILPKGQKVDYNFKSPLPKDASLDIASSYIKYWDSGLESQVVKYNITIPVTNFEHEIKKNDEKRGIDILKPAYLQQLLTGLRKNALYTKSTQTETKRLKRGFNLRLKSP